MSVSSINLQTRSHAASQNWRPIDSNACVKATQICLALLSLACGVLACATGALASCAPIWALGSLLSIVSLALVSISICKVSERVRPPMPQVLIENSDESPAVNFEQRDEEADWTGEEVWEFYCFRHFVRKNFKPSKKMKKPL